MEHAEKQFLNYFIKYIYEEKKMKYNNFLSVCSQATVSGIMNNTIFPNDSIYEDLLSILDYDFSYEEYFFSNEFEENCQNLYTAILYCDEDRIETVTRKIMVHCETHKKYAVEEVYASIFKQIDFFYNKHNSIINYEKLKIAKHFKYLLPATLQPIINQLLFSAFYSGNMTCDEEKITFSKENRIFDGNDPLLFSNKLSELNYTKQHILAFKLAEQYEKYYEDTNNQIRKFELYRSKLLIALNADQGMLQDLLSQVSFMEEQAKNILSNIRIVGFYYQLGVIYFCLSNFEKAYHFF